MKRIHSLDYNFCGDASTGLTMRWGQKLDENPVFAPWPELADISISNYCTKGCTFCYRNSSADGALMSIADYNLVLNQLTHPSYGPIFQVALGGGEPLEHPDFLHIIKITAERGIVANFTTNGIHLTSGIAKKLSGRVGAIALSTDLIANIPRNSIDIAVGEGIKTNLHFILNRKSIDDAIKILEGQYNDLLSGINSLIFLTYKPCGRAEVIDCLAEGPDYDKFLTLVEKNYCCIPIGFDACMIPPILHNTRINPDYIDSCECGFFSVYINENLEVKTCSFYTGNKFTYNLHEHNFNWIWHEGFKPYRSWILSRNCKNICPNHSDCRGACPFFPELKFCYRE